MKNDRDASVYLPKNLKAQIIEIARSEGYSVTRGRQSCLARFIEMILQEHNHRMQTDPTTQSLRSLTPQLRSSVLKLGAEDVKRQERAGAILALLLTDWQESEQTNEARLTDQL